MSDYYEKLAAGAKHTFWGYVGFELEELTPSSATVSLEIKQHHHNLLGIVHGGVLMTMLDNTMGLIMLQHPELRMVTATMNTHFLHNISTGRIYCKAELLHRTQRTITMTASIYNEQNERLAYASGSYRLIK